MKRIFCIITMIVCMFLFSCISAEADDSFVTENDAINIATTWLYQHYPSLSDIQIDNISIGRTIFFPYPDMVFYQGKKSWTVKFVYFGKTYLSTYVKIDADTGEIIDYDPWDFSAIVNFYDENVKEEQIISIAYDQYVATYNAKLQGNRALLDRKEAFLSKYGDVCIDPTVMTVECFLYGYPRYADEVPEQPRWNVRFLYPLPDPTSGEVKKAEWCSMEFDQFGNILDIETNFFSDRYQIIYSKMNLNLASMGGGSDPETFADILHIDEKDVYYFEFSHYYEVPHYISDIEVDCFTSPESVIAYSKLIVKEKGLTTYEPYSITDYYDDNVWIICFRETTMKLDFFIAIQKGNGKILRMWDATQ